MPRCRRIASFAGSLADNIAIFDDTPEFDRAMEAAEPAAIHDGIAAMQMGYETLVGDMGSALSGRQKRHVLLLRALCHRSKILVISERTSHLDPDHEEQPSAAIATLWVTRIIISHLDLSARQRRTIDKLRYLEFYHSEETAAYYDAIGATFPRGSVSRNLHLEASQI